MRVTEADLEAANAKLARCSPEEMLAWIHAAFGERAAILTSMQRAGAVLCNMAERAGLDFDVLFVDTGVLHQETLEARDRLASTHGHLRVKTLSPDKSFEDQTRERGLLYLSKEGQEACCALRKSAPLHALAGRYDALVGALRQDEGGRRSAIRPLGLDPEMRALRVHPFASLGREALDAYVAAHPDVVVNRLHLMGFPTIGCFPCTTPVRPDEPERAGRWRHLEGVAYCGINPTDGEPVDGVELPERVIDALDGLRVLSPGR